MTKQRIKCGNCPKRFAPKRSNQRHCSPACRNASYEKGVKGVARQKLYNATDKRKKVQAAYARSEKGAVRRDRWQYSKAGRAWREAFLKASKEAQRREMRERIQTQAQKRGISLSVAVRNYRNTTFTLPLKRYLSAWLDELEKAS